MAFQRVPGNGSWFPYKMNSPAMGLTYSTNALIDAMGEKTAVSGTAWFSERTGSKQLVGVGWRAGAIVHAGGSAILVSAQNVSGAAGPPQRPDETADQSVVQLLSSLNASAWNTSTFGSSRTLAYGDKLSIVWEYDTSTGRLGSDSLVVAHLTSQQTRPIDTSNVMLKTGGSWAVTSQNSIPNIILIFGDGTFGTLEGAFPCSDVGTLSVGTGTTPDEIAMQFSFPFPVVIDATESYIERTTGADWAMVLYDGNTALQTHQSGGIRNHSPQAGEMRFTGPQQFPAEQALTANTTYRIAVKPANANLVTVQYFDVAHTGHLVCHGGSGYHFWSRSAGTWGGQLATRNLLLCIRQTQFGDDAGTGGGIIVHPGLAGGMRG